ncbi:hypothetical protein Ahy_A01g003131 [Arachis hypogaea]|uniref:Uncharacterized protein n=1 Tax=Arachis hypogaea TaxID=3818 RepID=A0A445ESJ0_ARAHY|nr:hypothetical protein Ahy_A01g003131 [Arachis hypogaea]
MESRYEFYHHTGILDITYKNEFMEHYLVLFRLHKKIWVILLSLYFYKIKTLNRIIIDCCVLQNFIWLNMDFDPDKDTLLEKEQPLIEEQHGGNKDGNDKMTESVKLAINGLLDEII